jgi:hypothetical protein
MRHVLILVGALIFVMPLLTSCGSTEEVTAATPEEAAYESISCGRQPGTGGAPPDTFQVHERRPWGQGQILLYTVECPPTPPFNVSHLMVGYAYVEFAYGTWVGIGTAGSLINPEPVPLVHVQRGAGRGHSPQSSHAIVWGRVLSPDVTRLELTYADGTVVRDQPTNGMFAFITPPGVKMCTLQALEATGQVLYQNILHPCF